MDRLGRSADIMRAYYSYKRTRDAASFVKEVCHFFDDIKCESITESDMNFLLFLANEAGVPQYFDLLQDKFTDCRISDENIKVITLNALFHESSLIYGSRKLHRYQKDIIDKFSVGQRNRYILTAPTSFGKTYLIYEIIQKMKYNNVVLIFPTISLLSEIYTQLCGAEDFNEYAIGTLSEENFNINKKNIFIFTPERFLSFMDSHYTLLFDFAFIDEIYKIDNNFVIDREASQENERDTAYRLALEYLCRFSKDILLSGPYITIPRVDDCDNKSFNNFAEDNHFKFLIYNNFEIVSKQFTTIKNKYQYDIDGTVINIGRVSKYDKVINIILAISTPMENTIVYCGRRVDTEFYANYLLQKKEVIDSFHNRCSNIKSRVYEMFMEHLQNVFGEDWIVLKALRGRIGIHHGLIPKYIQKEIINLFNEGVLLCLFSTTTITEGVNTSAKNIIVTSYKKGYKILSQFDAKNIAGRAGRFYHHFSGRVIDLSNHFDKIISKTPEVLKHKNYDIETLKTDVDYQITKEKYLSVYEKNNKKDILSKIERLDIPLKIFNCFGVIGPKDKLNLYNRILNISLEEIANISRMSMLLAENKASHLYLPGFQEIINIISPIVKEKKLKKLISIRKGIESYSVITFLLHAYLSKGFLGMVNYYVHREKNPETKDEAMRKVSDIVYNVFKYHLVKYLGVFDVFFRYVMSNKMIKIDNIQGIRFLIQKLEYNAFSPVAKKVSDYGVPFKVIDYYNDIGQLDKDFDSYELYIFYNISKFIKQWNV